jgi:hypothetical protein
MEQAVIGFVGVIVGTLATIGYAWWSERTSLRRQARYLAVRVVCILDKFTDDCASVAGDDGLCRGETRPDGCHQVQVPDPAPPAFPEDLNWQSIDCNLMYRILSLPNAMDGVVRLLSSDDDLDTPPYDEYFEERQLQYAGLGLDVSQLAQTIRAAYAIPDLDQNTHLVRYMNEVKQRIEKQRDERATKYPAEGLSRFFPPSEQAKNGSII